MTGWATLTGGRDPVTLWRLVSAAASPPSVLAASATLARRNPSAAIDASTVVGTLAACIALKPVIAKPRPTAVTFADPWGFPSGHTAGAAALVCALPINAWTGRASAVAVASRVLLAGLIAGAVGTSRVRCGAHDKADVAAGCVLAAAVAAIQLNRSTRA